jgi:hypothetical protein
MAYLMVGANVDQVAKRWVHGDQIDPERPLRSLLCFGDFDIQHIGGHRAARDHAERPGVGQGGDKAALRYPAHRSTHDRDLAAEKIGAALH